ncbi:MAG TPA: glycosyltransferase [Amaricoccus sp.]|nr:glycosyltransferase [Amaricoccus sp.]
MPDIPPRITVVVPLYNKAGTIAATLRGLAAQKTDRSFEVLVVDDGSGDGGAEIARAAGAQLLDQPNGGPSAARNAGARAARGEIVLFLDADCGPPPNWVEAMAGALDDPRFDAVMGTIRPSNDGVIPRIVQLEIDERYEGMRKSADGVDFIAAPACGFRRSVFLALDGFDESLRQAEDVEIAYRLTARGSRIAFVEAAPVRHEHQTGWLEFLRAKHRRAVGRMRVFRIFPGKQRHDSWTPLSLKLQFAAVLAMVVALFATPFHGILAIATAAAAATLGLAAGYRTISLAADRLHPLVGRAPAVLNGAAFVLARGIVILAAVVECKLEGLFGRTAPWSRR